MCNQIFTDIFFTLSKSLPLTPNNFYAQKMSPYSKLTISAISIKKYLHSAKNYIYLEDEILYSVFQQNFNSI